MCGGRQRRTATVRAWALAALLVSACADRGPTADFHVQGVDVVVRSEVAFAAQPDLPARVESTLQVALAYWGGTFEQVAGMTVTLDGARTVACDGVAGAIGCYDGDIRVSTADAGVALDCVEQTVLVHEVGHAVIGDREHRDPRWMDFLPVAEALSGREGYRSDGATACAMSVSRWRHPPCRH
jgi:hypothetical protein